MATISIDVDLDEFDTSELIEELSYRISKQSFTTRKSFPKEKQEALKKKILEDFCDLPELLGIEGLNGFDIQTLDDKLKIEHLMQVFNKYSLTQIQSLLP